MIIAGFYAWGLYHSGLCLEKVSPTEKECAFDTPTLKKDVTAFLQTNIAQRLARYVHLFTSLDSQSALVICGHRQSRRFISHIQCREVQPEKTEILKVKSLPNTYVVTPLTYLLQRASIISAPKLLFLANAMLAKLCRFPYDEFDFSCNVPTKLLSSIPPTLISNGLPLHKYTITNTASLAECRLATILFSPTRWGGAGFSLAEANPKIVLEKRDLRHISGRRTLRPDFYWPKSKIAIEYDSYEHHSSPQQVANDKSKLAVTTSMGIKVFPVTKDILVNPLSRMALLRTISSQLGCKIPNTDSWQESHKALFQDVWYTHAVS